MHSKLVHEWNPDRKNETEGDGLYSNQKGIWLKVGVSDCNAVAVMGKERFGIVHAGRKGLQLGIIENLIYKGFVERDKKNLIATHKGISLVTIVSDTFKSAETTAKWEMELADIAKGKSSKEKFLKDIESEIQEAVLKYRK